MFTKEELNAMNLMLSRQGLKIDVTEMEAFIKLKQRIAQEFNKLVAAEKEIAEKAVKKTLKDAKKDAVSKPSTADIEAAPAK